MTYRTLPTILIALGLAIPVSGQSTMPEAPLPAARDTSAEPSATPAPPRDRPSPMLSNAELDTQRGGETRIITGQIMNAVTSGNVMGDYSAGDVSLSDFALSNFNGVGNLLINTGAQVSLQSGMNLTINLGN
jgi:hypothetical protein